jgi:hypothetical protein
MSDTADVRPADSSATATSGKAIASLILGSTSLLCNILTGLPALFLGILAISNINNGSRRLKGRGLAFAGMAVSCIGIILNCVALLLLPPKLKEIAARKQAHQNLAFLGVALKNYHDTNGFFPPPGSGGFFSAPVPGEKPLLSWRVAILQFLDRDDLYRQFKLDEPWDGPNNIKLLSKMPKVYQLPQDDAAPPYHTHYQVFVGNGAAFERERRMRIPEDFPNGTSSTILIVEAATAVPWTKPEDISLNPNEPITPLLSTYFGGTNAVTVDGTVRFFPKDKSESTLKDAINRHHGR